MKVHLWALVAVCCIAVALADPKLRDDDTVGCEALEELSSSVEKGRVSDELSAASCVPHFSVMTS